MPTRLRTEKVTDTITPLVTKVANDPELRDHAKTVLDSARNVYARVQAEGPKKAAANRDVTDEVVKAAIELKQAASKLMQPPKRRGRRLVRLAIGAAIAAAAVVGIKKTLSSDEDEFEYTP